MRYLLLSLITVSWLVAFSTELDRSAECPITVVLPTQATADGLDADVLLRLVVAPSGRVTAVSFADGQTPKVGSARGGSGVLHELPAMLLQWVYPPANGKRTLSISFQYRVIRNFDNLSRDQVTFYAPDRVSIRSDRPTRGGQF